MRIICDLLSTIMPPLPTDPMDHLDHLHLLHLLNPVVYSNDSARRRSRMMCEGMAICSICGQEHPVEDLTRFDGHNLCSDCLRSRTCLCDRCHDRIWRKDDHGEDALTLCQRQPENVDFRRNEMLFFAGQYEAAMQP